MTTNEHLPIVQWQDKSDGGWREGVVMCVLAGDNTCVTASWMRRCFEYEKAGFFAYMKPAGPRAIIYDRHRNERAIVPLSEVELVKPRCDRCDGRGWVEKEPPITYWSEHGDREQQTCDVCQGTGKAGE